MRIDFIEEFLAAAEAKNITLAAKKMFMTQPVLSKHIKALEDELGAKLFSRSPRGLELTPSGRMAYESFRRISSEYRALTEQLCGAAKETPLTLSVGMLNLGSERYTMPIARALRKRQPNIKVAFKTEKPRDIVAGLLDSTLDVGFFPVATYQDRGQLSYVPIGKEEVSLAVREGHGIRADGTISPEDVAGSPLICLKERETSDLMNHLLKATGFQPKEVVEADELEVAAALIVDLDGYFAIPEFMVSRFKAFPSITVAPLQKPIFQTISFAYKTDNSNRALKLFIDEAMREFPEDPARS